MRNRSNHPASDCAIGPGAGLLPFETGARFFATLAFPASTEEQARVDAERAWIASWLHEQNRVDGTEEPFIEKRLNELVCLDPSWARQKLRTARRRLRDRGEAARLTRPWVRELTNLEPHRAVEGIKRFTMRQIALHLCNDNDDAAHNFQKRIWRPSRPVLHYAIAHDQALSLLEVEERETGIQMDAEAVFRTTTEQGNRLAAKIAADPRFGISADDQILLQWID